MDLAHDYCLGTLPPVLQEGLVEFLEIYMYRGVAGIDPGLLRWPEDPLCRALASYLRLINLSRAPDTLFRHHAGGRGTGQRIEP